MNRASRAAYRCFRYLRGIKNLEGWLRIGIRKIADHFDVTRRTVLRWLRELREAGWIRTIRRGRAANGYTIMPAKNVTSKCHIERPHIRKELREVSPTGKVHHRDEAETPIEEQARLAAGMERLSQQDRAWLKTVSAPEEVILGGIFLARARKLASSTVAEPIRCLRYFAQAIAEATHHPIEYLRHAEGFIRRHA